MLYNSLLHLAVLYNVDPFVNECNHGCTVISYIHVD